MALLFAPRMRSSFLSFTVTIVFMTLKEFTTWPLSFSFPFFVRNFFRYQSFTVHHIYASQRESFHFSFIHNTYLWADLIAHFVIWEMVDISHLTFAVNLILNLTGSKQCIDNVFILIARIVFKSPTDEFNSAGTNHTSSVKYPILYFIQSISASFCQKKLIKQRRISSNELLCFSTHGTAYCFFDAHLKC